MPQLIIAVFILWFLVYGLKMFTRANPAVLARAMKTGGGLVALVMGVFLLVRGQIEIGLALGGLAAWLLGWSASPSWRQFAWKKGARAGRAGRVSRVRSAMIEMELDHETGTMQGTVLAGPFEGKPLASLARPQCETLFDTCRRDDPEGSRLLEAYLDRRFPGWRMAGQRDGDARGGAGRRPGAMSEDEAYEVLGLQKGASREDVSRAHRTLMKKLHPDHGGSTNLAAMVNEAKDVLMRRHTN